MADHIAMPRTLYAFILKELLKTLALSTAVLVVILSVGAAAKPLSDGLLEPLEIIKLIVLLVPGMFAHAMPFAMVFSVTLVYFRLASENEITACAASGISYRQLLLPVGLLGGVLSLALIFSSNFLIPHVWQLIGRIVEKDLAKMMVEQLERGHTVHQGRLVMYADRVSDGVLPIAPPGKPQPHRRLVLDGVAVGQLEDGQVVADYTTERAVVDFYRIDDRSFFTMKLSNFVINNPAQGAYVRAGGQPFNPIEIPSPFRQEPEFLTLPRLLELKERPLGQTQVNRRREYLLRQVVRIEALETVRRELGRTEGVPGTLRMVDPTGRTVTLRSPRVEATEQGDALALSAVGDDPVVVKEIDDGRVASMYQARRGLVRVGSAGIGHEAEIQVELIDVTITDPRLGEIERTQTSEKRLSGLEFGRALGAAYEQMSVEALIKLGRASDDQRLRWAAADLKDEVVELRIDIVDKISERMGLSVACLIVGLLGATMAMRLRRQGPLPIFFWAFVPTVLGILLLFSGGNYGGADLLDLVQGLVICWSGLVGLIVLNYLVYRKLARN